MGNFVAKLKSKLSTLLDIAKIVITNHFKFFLIQTINQFKTKNTCFIMNIWYKVFKNRPTKICGRQPLKF